MMAETVSAEPYGPELREVAIFAADVPDRQTLIDGLRPGVTYHVLSPDGDGLAEMATHLAGYRDLEALHIISHGAPGKVFLGSDAVTQQTLRHRAGVFDAIRSALTEDAHVSFYCCRVAEGSSGQAFVNEWAKRLNRSVAATDRSLGFVDGSVSLELNKFNGFPKVDKPPFLVQEYYHHLAIPSDENFDDDSDPTSFSNTNTFTHDGVTYSITGANGPYSSEISSNGGPLSGGSDLAMIFDTGGNASISQVEISIGGDNFQLSSLAFDAVSINDVTLSSDDGGNLNFTSNNSFVTKDPIDLSSNANFQNIPTATAGRMIKR